MSDDDFLPETPDRHNVMLNRHFAAWLAAENRAGRFPTVDEAGARYDAEHPGRAYAEAMAAPIELTPADEDNIWALLQD